ncbi:23459_t:CDS:1, partial [Dentiscutata erythropus]
KDLSQGIVFNNLRLTIPSNVPKLIADLIINCWDADPKRRPTSRAICDNINMWIKDLSDNSTELFAQIKKADKRLLSSISAPSCVKEHHEVIYFSPLSTENIRNIVDSDKQYSNLGNYRLYFHKVNQSEQKIKVN